MGVARPARSRLPVLLRARLVATAVAALTLATACGGGHQFVADHRVHITMPRQRSTVSLPVTVRWSYDDLRLTGARSGDSRHAGYFGVFVDRTPVPAGKDLRWLARDDPSCRADQGCPNQEYFTSRQIFTTEHPEITFEQLPKPRTHHGPETHTVTVVLFDGSGRRIGESAWYVDFHLTRSKSQ